MPGACRSTFTLVPKRYIFGWRELELFFNNVPYRVQRTYLTCSRKLKQVYEHAREGTPRALNRPVRFRGDISPEVSFLAGCTGGLLYYTNGRLVRLLKGKHYGVTSYRGRWYVYRKVDRWLGQLLSFRLEDQVMVDLRLERSFLPRTIHQIDVIHDRLYAVNTLNSILQFAFTPEGLRPVGEIIINGSLPEGKASPNYCHVNSIYGADQSIYLVYHNTTTKSQRPSQVAVFDMNFQQQQIIEINGIDAHNVFRHGNRLVYCDSGRGLLVWGDRVIRAEKMTRGLAISDELILLGGSTFAERAARSNTAGTVYFLKYSDLSLLGSLEIPSAGGVQELRFVDRPDYGLSARKRPLSHNCG